MSAEARERSWRSFGPVRLVVKLYGLTRTRTFEIVGSVVGATLLVNVLRTGLQSSAQPSFAIVPALGALISFFCAWVGLSVAWGVLSVGRSSERAIAGWMRSQILRYIPGGFWAPMARFSGLEGSPVSRAKVLALETLGLLTSAVVVGAATAAVVFDARWLLAEVVAVPALAALFITVRSMYHSATTSLLWISIQLISVALYMIGSGLAQISISTDVGFMEACAAGLLSWAVGFVVFFSPGGIGVKEWGYLWFFSEDQTSQAALGTLSARILFVAAELLALLVVVRRSIRPPMLNRGEAAGPSAQQNGAELFRGTLPTADTKRNGGSARSGRANMPNHPEVPR